MNGLGLIENTMHWIDGGLSAINRRLNLISYTVVGLMVIPIVLDVILRLLLRRSLMGVIELQEFALVLVAFLGFSQIESLNENIRIDLLVNRFPHHIKTLLNNLNCLLACIFCSMATWQTVITATKKLRDRSLTFDIPISIFIGIAALGLLLLSLTLLKKYLSSLIEIVKEGKAAWLIFPLIVGALFLLLPVYVKSVSFGVSGLGLGVLGIVVLFLMLLTGMPLGFAIALIGYIGLFIVQKNSLAVFGVLGATPYFQTANYILVVLPMFMLMGALTYVSGISTDLFDAAQKWFGRVPGGLAVSSVVGCAGFAAVSGDSMSTAVTMTTAAFPEMKRHKYDASIAAGCLAAGGTLGILIPPSIGFIIYSIITEESVGKLFVAGIIPGILLTLLFIVSILFMAALKPQLFPPGQSYPLKERFHSLKGIWAVIVTFVIILGGMLGGLFSPNEGGAVGAFAIFVIALLRKRLSYNDFIASLKDTASITAKIFLIIIGVGFFGYFLAATRFPSMLADFILELGLSKYAVFAAISLLYIVLGCVMNVIPMIMLTLPAIFPSILALGFDPVWFGVVIVILMEMGQISPPIGMNVFAISTVSGVPMGTVFKGILPFFLCMVLCIVILVLFPQIALWLVQVFY